jgi:hypothetical protein
VADRAAAVVAQVEQLVGVHGDVVPGRLHRAVGGAGVQPGVQGLLRPKASSNARRCPGRKYYLQK